MKVKTSVTLSEEVLEEVDRRVSLGGRSLFIEAALKERLLSLRRAESEARDVEIYNRLADDPENQREFEETMAVSMAEWELGDEVELADDVVERLRLEGEARGAR